MLLVVVVRLLSCTSDNIHILCMCVCMYACVHAYARMCVRCIEGYTYPNGYDLYMHDACDIPDDEFVTVQKLSQEYTIFRLWSERLKLREVLKIHMA